MNNKIDIAEIYEDSEAQSHRILNCYVRYMIKRFKLRNFDHSLLLTCPKYHKYLYHVIGLILKAKTYSNLKYKFLKYPPTNCKEIDILINRFVERKFKINIKYERCHINTDKKIFKPYKLTFVSFLKDIFLHLRQVRSSKNKIDFNVNTNQKGILILSHQKNILSEYTDAYYSLSKKLINFFKHKQKYTMVILPHEIGLTNLDKFTKSFLILNLIIKNFKIIKIPKLSDIHFLICDYFRQLYKNKLREYFIKNNISTIICSFIYPEYEPIFYEVAKELKIQYFKYDYSLGYPIKNLIYSRYLPDRRKYTDVIFSSSGFRSDQYKSSSNFMDNPTTIFPHICPQIDYAKIIKLPKIFINKTKIGIVDNVIADDAYLNNGDIDSLLKILAKNHKNKIYILQSKRGHLKSEFQKWNFKNGNIIDGIKGDFSQLQNSDLIISLGWQGTALKAAFTFNKPLIFYSKLGFPYSEHIFYSDKKKNKKIKDYCKTLWFSKNNFNPKLKSIFNDEKNFNYIKGISSKLLNQIDFYSNNIQYSFEKYLK